MCTISVVHLRSADKLRSQGPEKGGTRPWLRRLEEQDQKHGSLIIPDSAKEKPQEGQVIAVGAGKVSDDGKHLPLAVKEGDRILFGKYSGSEVKLDGEEYLIMREEDVLGILGS